MPPDERGVAADGKVNETSDAGRGCDLGLHRWG